MTTAPSPPPSPSPMNRRPKRWAKKCERACCQTFTYFPLAFVYALTTWAVWVEAGIGLRSGASIWSKHYCYGHGCLLTRGCRYPHFFPWDHSLPSSKLVLHHRRLHRPWFPSLTFQLLAPPHSRSDATRCAVSYGQVDWRDSVLQKMQSS